MGKVSGLIHLRITGCNFGALKTGLSPMGGRLLYDAPLEVSGRDLDSKHSFLADDTYLSDLTNAEFPGPMTFYYGELRHMVATIWGYS